MQNKNKYIFNSWRSSSSTSYGAKYCIPNKNPWPRAIIFMSSNILLSVYIII